MGKLRHCIICAGDFPHDMTGWDTVQSFCPSCAAKARLADTQLRGRLQQKRYTESRPWILQVSLPGERDRYLRIPENVIGHRLVDDPCEAKHFGKWAPDGDLDIESVVLMREHYELVLNAGGGKPKRVTVVVHNGDNR